MPRSPSPHVCKMLKWINIMDGKCKFFHHFLFKSNAELMVGGKLHQGRWGRRRSLTPLDISCGRCTQISQLLRSPHTTLLENAFILLKVEAILSTHYTTPSKSWETFMSSFQIWLSTCKTFVYLLGKYSNSSTELCKRNFLKIGQGKNSC